MLAAGVIALIAYGMRPQPVEVEVAALSRGPLTVHITEEGKTRIRNRYVVAAPVAGQMRRVSLRPGDAVEAGKTVLTAIEPGLSPLLDPRAKAQAEARVQAAEAGQMQAGQSVEMSKTALQFAKQNWDRVQRVNNKGSISETDRDNAERDAAMRERELRAAEFALKVSSYELEQAKAALLQLESPGASVSVIQVHSPVSGKVLRVMQESAMLIAAGIAIIEIGDPADLEIEAEILSRDAIAIQPGAVVSIGQWGGEKPLEGRVRRIEPAAFTKVSALGVEEQRVIVLSDLVNPPPEAQSLGDRYRVEVKIAVWKSDDVLLIPAGALFREGSEWKTFVLKQGKAKAVTVQAGRSDGRQSQVLGGIEAGAEVLLHPPDTVKDGVAVMKRQD